MAEQYPRPYLHSSPRHPELPTMICQWCSNPIRATARRDSKFCGKRCRQASWRFRIGRPHQVATDHPMRFAYADPPYPGHAHRYPEHEEVDHAALIDRLTTDYPDGWALSTSSMALQMILLLCPPTVRVAAWFRRPRPTKSQRPLTSWEPIILHGGRPLNTSVVQDLADTLSYQGHYRAYPGAVLGMKPPQFATWVFDQLGAAPGDQLDDLYPGSGAVSRAWERYTSPVAPADENGKAPTIITQLKFIEEAATPPRRYGQHLIKVTAGLPPNVLRALRAMVPHGERANFIEQAIRAALAEQARLTGTGDLPGERLTAIAQALRRQAEVLDHEADRWGDL